MKIKNFVASIFTVSTLALIGISAQAQTVDAATVSMTNTSGVVYITNANGAQIYSSPDGYGQMTKSGSALSNESAWKYNSTATIDGAVYYQVGTNAWVSAADLTTTAPAIAMSEDMYVQANGGVNVYDSANGNYVGYVNGGDKVHVEQSQTDNNGTIWYNIGSNRWIKGDFIAKENIKETLTMSATAYDPAVLGSNMGYTGVAANLSKFPKGTHLRITASNGQTYDRIVNDTGLFAYSNPNQLDIAMPNSEALQFGRQNITVQVIG